MKRVPEIKTEQEAAALVVAFLEEHHYDVYQEVELGGSVADIVALHGPEVWVIEVKMVWSLDLLEQLREHKRRCHGHRLYAAVPFTRNWHERERLFRDCGFGVIAIHGPQAEQSRRKFTGVTVTAPRVTPKLLPHIIAKLDPGHKTHAKAGAIGGGGRFTPFRQTCEALALIVRNEPGLIMKDAMAKLKHHYSSDASARSCLLKLIQEEVIPHVVAVVEGKFLRLYPEAPPRVWLDHELPQGSFEVVSLEDL